MVTLVIGGFICGEEHQLEFPHALEKIREVGLTDFSVKKLDDFSIVVHKISRWICVLIAQEYNLRFIRRFELIGVPFHLWSEENIKKIGSKLGIVLEVHFKPHNFTSVEVKFTTESTIYRPSIYNALTITNCNKTFQVSLREIVSNGEEDCDVFFYH